MARKSAPLALEYILLALIAEKPAHGYDLYRTLKAIGSIHAIWNLKQSLMYALLDKLEEGGMIEGRMVADETRPSRRIYSLTEIGDRAYQEWLTSPVKHGRDMRQDFLARYHFARSKGAPQALSLIEKQKLECQSWLENLQKSAEGLANPENDERVVISFRIFQVKAMLDWLDSCRQDLIH